MGGGDDEEGPAREGVREMGVDKREKNDIKREIERRKERVKGEMDGGIRSPRGGELNMGLIGEQRTPPTWVI